MENTEVVNTAKTVSAEERQWGLIVHLSSIFLGFLGPLIIWQMKKATMPFLDDQGKEALNFQITVLLLVIVSCVLFIVFIGMFLLPIVLLGNLILSVIAGIKANNGEYYRYPLTLRLIK